VIQNYARRPAVGNPPRFLEFDFLFFFFFSLLFAERFSLRLYGPLPPTFSCTEFCGIDYLMGWCGLVISRLLLNTARWWELQSSNQQTTICERGTLDPIWACYQGVFIGAGGFSYHQRRRGAFYWTRHLIIPIILGETFRKISLFPWESLQELANSRYIWFITRFPLIQSTR